MSKHVGRKHRWTQLNAKSYASSMGKIVYEHDGWYALLNYKTFVPPEVEGGLPSWHSRALRLGPFRRPRNAMVALEREVTVLHNRHGKDVLIGDQLWPEG